MRRVVGGMIYVLGHGLHWKDAHPKPMARIQPSITVVCVKAAWGRLSAFAMSWQTKDQSLRVS